MEQPNLEPPLIIEPQNVFLIVKEMIPFDMNGQSLKKLVKSMGFTQEKFAKFMGFSERCFHNHLNKEKLGITIIHTLRGAISEWLLMKAEREMNAC